MNDKNLSITGSIAFLSFPVIRLIIKIKPIIHTKKLRIEKREMHISDQFGLDQSPILEGSSAVDASLKKQGATRASGCRSIIIRNSWPGRLRKF
jgi:hypothetical protein